LNSSKAKSNTIGETVVFDKLKELEIKNEQMKLQTKDL
jgi:hypothetical protein